MKPQVKIISATYLSGYKIKFKFSDGKENTFDYESLVMRDHGESIPYRKIEKFKKFKIVDGGSEIAWGNNWNMILPFETIYKKTHISNAGRKRIKDKKLTLRIYVRESIVEKNGGLIKAQEKCLDLLSKAKS